MYCKHCMMLVNGDVCDNCGNEHLIEPCADDLVLVAEKTSMWAGMLADVFRQHNITYYTEERLGAAITMLTGSSLESLRFYVPLAQQEQALDILEGLFGAGQLIDDYDEYDDDDEYDEEDEEDDDDDFDEDDDEEDIEDDDDCL